MNGSEETIGNDAQQNENTEDTSAHPMDAFLEEEAYGLDSPRRGEVRTGTIARITDTDILVDIGYKSEGLIPGRELERLPTDKREELIVGKEVTVYVLRSGGTDGTILLSISRAEEEQDWIEAERLLKTKDAFEGVISGYNKGGLIVKLGHLRGFIPASQVSMARRWRADGDNAEQRWGKMVGEPIVSKVIEVERRRNRLILSERAAAREARDILKMRLIEDLELGEIRTGHVISLADFGAFVDIGGADGLVHTSEISWKRINHPRDVLKVGQEVQVKVLAVDPEQKRISLSMRELEPDPWDTIINHYMEGQLVEGTITKLTKFGAFASLKAVEDYELEGLVHISELSDRHIVHPREVVGENETLTLRVIKVDRKRRRIGLSLKKVDSPEYAELDWQAAMEELQSGDEDEAEKEDLGISISPADEDEAVAEVEQPAPSEVDEDQISEVDIEGTEVAQDLEADEEADVEEAEESEAASVLEGAEGTPEEKLVEAETSLESEAVDETSEVDVDQAADAHVEDESSVVEGEEPALEVELPEAETSPEPEAVDEASEDATDDTPVAEVEEEDSPAEVGEPTSIDEAVASEETPEQLVAGEDVIENKEELSETTSEVDQESEDPTEASVEPDEVEEEIVEEPKPQEE
jgi:small subunit ribosomal protein S1